MKHDIIVAGVGGQGILTIARGLSRTALDKGYSVKQAEVHGMSQRGGAVYSHVRISDKELFSDLIPAGQANMVLAVEPLEALRYVQYLRADGVVIANTNAMMNLTYYPAIEEVLDRVATHPRHVLIDMEKLARAAGSPLAANMVGLGAASLFLSFSLYFTEYFHYLNRCFRIQVSCGFISKYDGRSIYERPGNSHPLALAARKFIGFMMTPVCEPYTLQHFQRLFSSLFFPRTIIHQWKGYIFYCR